MTEQELKQQFQSYKAEYSKIAPSVSKEALVGLMRENLRQRTSEKEICCLDGKKYSIDSDEVADLYAIDGALSANASSQIMNSVAESMRKKAERINKYGPNNPYPPQCI